MSSEQEDKARAGAREALKRMQEFDVSGLPREHELGSELNFHDAVLPAQRLIQLYKQISLSALEDIPNQQLNNIATQAGADYNRLQGVIGFSQKVEKPYDERNRLITALDNAYGGAFTTLHPFISYSTSKSADFKRLENDARAMIQRVEDQGKTLVAQLEDIKDQANSALAEARRVAAEQGVSQQAVYFRDEADAHSGAAQRWKWGTFACAGVMFIYAVVSLFLHKIPQLAPSSNHENIQLAVSKVLIFAVISYLLYLCARNFLAHTHNAIVNKHRQNALMTFKALVDASGRDDNKEVILHHAAACIFGPQSSGYSREAGRAAPSAKSVVELLTKPFTPDAD